MDAVATTRLKPAAPRFAELLTPELVPILREGYGWTAFRADAVFDGTTERGSG